MKPYLSVIIPAYNEEKIIAKTINDIEDFFLKQHYNYDILIVNDGSVDNTKKIIENLQKDKKNIKILNNDKNLGKGYSVKKGLLEAEGDLRLFMDADSSTNIDQVEKLLSFLYYGYDVIIGSRGIDGSKIIIKQPLYRRILGYAYKTINRLFIGLTKINDTQCGFKLFTEKVVKDVIPRCEINGWSFDSEILVIAQKLGYKIKESPIIWTNNNNSKVKICGMTKSVFDLMKIKLNIITKKYE